MASTRIRGRRSRGPVLLAVALAVASVGCGGSGDDAGAGSLVARVWDRTPLARANVSWPTSRPAAEGLDAEALERLWSHQSEFRTRALLVARNGRLVFERYGSGGRANRKLPIAAAAKGVTAGLVSLLALADGELDLDAPLTELIPAWESDAARSRIRVRHLLTHSSGIENVSFAREHTGWKADYRRDRARRIAIALHRAPMRFPPGDRYEYSGVGFYVLAYALARGGDGALDATARLDARVMTPLGIPRRAWRLSYGEHYDFQGMRIQAIGSGADYTARALARVGQLLLDRGRLGDTELLPAHWVDTMLRYAESPPERPADARDPAAGLGVWLNCDGFFPLLPRDAAIAAGGKQQILLLVPSLDLLVVRLGEGLGEWSWFGDYWEALDRELFEPLAAALPAPAAAPKISCGKAAAFRATGVEAAYP